MTFSLGWIYNLVVLVLLKPPIFLITAKNDFVRMVNSFFFSFGLGKCNLSGGRNNLYKIQGGCPSLKIFPKEVRGRLVTGSLRALLSLQLNFRSWIARWMLSSGMLELTHLGSRELIFSMSSQLPMISCWQFEIGGDGSIYTRKIGKYHKSCSFLQLTVKHLPV